MTGPLKRHAIADLELQHLRMRPHVNQESQPFDDTVVQLVDVNFHAHLIEDKAHSRYRLTQLPKAIYTLTPSASTRRSRGQRHPYFGSSSPSLPYEPGTTPPSYRGKMERQ